MLEQVYPERLQPTDRTHTGAEKWYEVEEAADRNCYGLTVTPISVEWRRTEKSQE